MRVKVSVSLSPNLVYSNEREVTKCSLLLFGCNHFHFVKMELYATKARRQGVCDVYVLTYINIQYILIFIYKGIYLESSLHV